MKSNTLQQTNAVASSLVAGAKSAPAEIRPLFTAQVIGKIRSNTI